MSETIRPATIYDPTTLTREQIAHDINALREVLHVRLDGIEKAAATFAESIQHFPTALDREINKTSKLSEERFGRIEQHFADADRRYTEKFDAADLRYQQRYDASDKALAAASQAAATAVNSALAAAKEAVQAASLAAEKAVAAQNESNAASISKSEQSVTKQIDSGSVLLATTARTLDEKIAALTIRIAGIDGNTVGRGASQSQTIILAGLAISIIMGAYNIFGSHVTAAPPPYYQQPPYYQSPYPQPQQQPQVNVVPVVPVPVPAH